MDRSTAQLFALTASVTLLAGCAAAIPALQSGAAAIAAHASAAPLVAAAGAAGVGLGVGVVASDDIKRLAKEVRDTSYGTPSPGTLGAYFQENQKTTVALVESAMKSQRDAQVAAGMQVHAVLARGQAAFRDSRHTKVEALTEPAAGFKSSMDAVLAELASPSDSAVKAAGERAQAIGGQIRLAATVPQIRAAGAVYLFPFLPSQSITVRGVFPEAYPRESQPELALNGKVYKALEMQRDSLRFFVPITDFDSSEPKETVWRIAELTVPWNRQVVDFTTFTDVSKFNVAVGVLTQSFGSLEMESTVVRVRTEERPRLSEPFAFSTEPDKAETSRCVRLNAQELSEGWRIRASTGSVVSEPALGSDWKDLGMQSETDGEICWKVRALREETNSPGTAASWRISVRMIREIRETDTARESVDLAWGGKHAFKVAGPWKLRYTRNGGAVGEVAAQAVSDPLLKIQPDGSTVRVSVYPF